MRFNQHGLMAFEFLISIAISGILCGILLNYYLQSKQMANLSSSVRKIQLSGNDAIQFINSEIHLAGYIGCPRLSESFHVLPYQQYNLMASNKLVISGAELISRHAARKSATLLQYDERLYVSDNITFRKNDVLLISNCKCAEIFQIAKFRHVNNMIIITPKAPLRCKLEENMEVSPFIENRIFIKKSNTIAGDSALYVKNRNALAKPVAYGIEAVHFDSIFQAEMLIGIKYEIHQFAEKMESIRHAYALI